MAQFYLPGVERSIRSVSFQCPVFRIACSPHFFPELIAASVRLTHLHVDYALFFGI